MRIDRLLLGRYGHLSDLDLAFPAENGLHVVLGPNEAGKSTALAAIGDCLFGFPHRTNFAFLHDTHELRVALTLRAASGRIGTFLRRKKRKDDLCDEQDQPVPESAIAAFLSGTNRERFERVFGLDAAELRRGGESILRGEGDVGQSILQAHTGMHGFRDLLKRLDADASRLFGDRRGTRELHRAADAFNAARNDRDARAVEPAAYREAHEGRNRLRTAGIALRAEEEALRAERERLERIRSTAPARKALARALPELKAMGVIPPLPEDAEKRRLDAIASRETSADALRRERQHDEELAAGLEALTIDTELLTQGEFIDRLAGEQSRIEGAQRDCDVQRLRAAQHRRDVEDSSRRMGQADDIEKLAARMPGAMLRGAVNRAIDEHVKLADRRATAREKLEEAEREQGEAILGPEPSDALRDALDRANSEGQLDADLAKAEAALTSARRELADSLAALPLWTGTAEELARLTIPLRPIAEQLATTLAGSEEALRSCRTEAARLDKALETTAADISALSVSGELPTAEAIRAMRDTRDRAWRLLRRHRLSAGAPPTGDELEGLGPAERLVDTFESLLHEADTLVDRRADDSARVATFEQLRITRARDLALRANAGAAITAAETAYTADMARWTALWHPAVGVVPLDPPAMRDWRSLRDGVLGKLKIERQAMSSMADVEARHAATWASLATLLPPTEAASTDRSIANLKQIAMRVCGEQERRSKALTDARDKRRALVAAENALDVWRSKWAPLATALGLAPDTAAEDGKLALDLWSQVETHLGKWKEASDRVAEMTLLIEGFRDAAAALVGRLTLDLVDTEMHESVRTLTVRLSACRINAATRATMEQERNKHRTNIEALIQAHDDSENKLASLRFLAGATEDSELQAVIVRAAEHASLSREIAERMNDIRPFDKGMSLEELEREAVGTDPDGLGTRIAEIDERMKEISEEKSAIAGQLATQGALLAAMETGRDAADAAQAMHNALAEADDIAGRYIRLRMAHTLLAAGIERFRQEQQGPLLRRAGDLFALLTEGRYDRLTAGETEDGKLIMIARRPHGGGCPADRLSDGTRDQLYLALRLAAIEGHAERTEPLPFIADDLLVNFSDSRARAAIRVLAEFGARTQTILFTHHAHIAAMAEPHLASRHEFPGD